MIRRAGFTDISGTDVATLMLRFGSVRVRARLYWPRATPAPPISVLFAGTRDLAGADCLSRGVCVVARSVVLGLPADSKLERQHELAALEWAAEHAAELGADPRRLMIGGHLEGGARAAALAVETASRGWPHVARQLAVHPAFTVQQPMPSRVDSAPAATIVTTGDRTDGGKRYAISLRSSGVEVDELRHPPGVLLADERGRGAMLADLARSLGGQS
jgi:hypothetical protein